MPTALIPLPGPVATSLGAPRAVAPLQVSEGQSAQHTPNAGVPVAAVDSDAIRTWDARVDRLAREGDLRLVRCEQDTVLTTRSHERLQQSYKGVPIVGGEVTRQIDHGFTVSIFGRLYLDIDLDVMPVVTVEKAQDIVERRTGAPVSPDSQPTLVILPLDAGPYALAWQVETRSATDVLVSFVDATSGTVLLEYSTLKTQQASVGRGTGLLGDSKALSLSTVAGTYAAVDRRRGATITTFDLGGDVERTAGAVSGILALGSADVASAASPVWTDGAVVDAHAHVAATYDYYLQRFGRRGLDGRDMPIATIVHPVRRQDWSVLQSPYGLYFTNAFWNGRLIVFGEGLPPGVTVDGRSWNSTSAAIDIVAHEATHAVIDFSSKLIYRYESGALNEAFSDIMATAVEFFFQPAGSGPMKADYLVAEDAVSGGGLRSLANPAAHGNPDHYAKRYTGGADNGGVRTNSTIVSHAYYLAIEGGTNRTSGLSVAGVGRAHREQIEKVFYRAFVYLLPSSATFATARAAATQAARDLYGAGSAAERAVAQAWAAVGVEP